MDLAAHLRGAIAIPSGLTDTCYDVSAEPHPDYVFPAVADSDLLAVSEQVRRTGYPAGGIISTVDDLLSYGRMLLAEGRGEAGRVVSPATVRTLWRTWTAGLPGACDFRELSWRTERGLGWALGGPGDLHSDRTLWHSGAPGTSMWIDPSAGLVIVLLTATWFLDQALLARIANVAVAAVIA